MFSSWHIVGQSPSPSGHKSHQGATQWLYCNIFQMSVNQRSLQSSGEVLGSAYLSGISIQPWKGFCKPLIHVLSYLSHRRGLRCISESFGAFRNMVTVRRPAGLKGMEHSIRLTANLPFESERHPCRIRPSLLQWLETYTVWIRN